MPQPPPFVDYPPTFPNLLARTLRRFSGNDVVITEGGRHVTYAEVDRASGRLARRLLANGVGKGTRVGILFPQTPEWVISFLGIARAGAVAVTISTFSTGAEIVRLLRHGDVDTLLLPATLLGHDQAAMLERAVPELVGSDASAGPLFLADLPYLRRVWIMGAAAVPPWASAAPWEDEERWDRGEVPVEVLAAAEAEVHPSDPVVVVYTSGTTSAPKGVIHTHGALVRQGESLRRVEVALEGDRLFAGMPFFWIGGVSYTLGPALHAGATLLTMERFEAGAALRFMERERATAMTGWMNLTKSLLEHPYLAQADLSTMRKPVGAVTRPRSGLGMTETAASYLYFGPGEDPIPDVAGASGEVMEGREVRIADPDTNATVGIGELGEVCVRGFSVTVGMVKREDHEVFDADGWYHTGDRGFVTDEGVVGFIGRITEMIKTKGSNVAPPEVEAVLQQHPGVKFAHVLGIPDPGVGERVGAVVVPRHDVLDLEDVKRFAVTLVANYKVPTRFVVLRDDQVPTLASGKADRLAMRRLLTEAEDH